MLLIKPQAEVLLLLLLNTKILPYQFPISLSREVKFNVFSVKNLYINKELKRVYTKNYPIYAYYFPRTGNYKIYIPNENKWNKWDTNANNDWDIQGYDQLPEKGETVYITKSMKDCMVMYELGLNAVATQVIVTGKQIGRAHV